MRGGLAPVLRVCALAAALGLVVAARPAGAILTGLPSGFVDELVVGGLPFPTAVAFTPDGKMLVALKRGEVRIYQGTTPLGTFIDIADRVHDNHDRGLLGLAVHPNFPATPYVYLLYAHDPPGVYPDGVDPSAPPPTSVSARVAQLLRVEADPATGYTTAKPGTEVLLLGTNSTRANIGSENNGRDTAFASCMSPLNMSGTPVEDCLATDEDSHTIGTVVFAPDGSLFVSSGDGSNYSAVDKRAMRAQNLDSLSGKILRIDPLTGAGLPGNPFFDPANPGKNRSKVWAYGLRNPFRISIQPATSEPFIGDVGWNTWEEINTGKGANFGWPCYEGGPVSGSESGTTTSLQQSGYRSNAVTGPQCQALYNQGLGAVKAPIFSYDHSLGGASANGGAFYTSGPYPPEYVGALFIADYSRRWIRYLTFDAQGNATVHPFGAADTGPVQVVVGPDSNLYWMRYQSTGGELRRVRYTGAGNTPPVVIIEATPTIGVAPLSVSFDSTGSYDPDAQAFTYDWDFGDGASSSEANPTHMYDAGVYDAVLTLTEQTAPFASNSETVRITVGTNPPLATILAPEDGDSYRVGDVIAFAGSATEGSDPVPADQITWELRTHHNQHLHYDALPAAPDVLDPFLSVGSLTVLDHGDDVHLQICITVTLVPAPITDTQCVEIFPEKTEITLATDPIGLKISYEDEGIEVSGPALIHPVVNSVQTISVLPIQQHRTFTEWADGPTSLSRVFTTGTAPETFTALYENLAPTAAIAPAGASGLSPLTVAFDGLGSSDPEGDILQYAWDAGAAGTSSAASPSFTFPVAGDYPVTLTVTDQLGATGTAQVVVSVNDGAPIPLITSPGASASWRSDGAVVYAGEAVDPNAGPLPPSQLSWEFFLHYCDAQGQNCQEQLVGTAEGVAGGGLFVPTGFAPGSLSPAFLELRLTARTLPAEGWFDPAWTRRRPIAIDNTAQAQTLIDFPVLVRLDPSRIQYAAALPGGQDLRFTDASGQLLAHEIETWNPGGESVVWVKVPSIPASSGSGQIFMYYGNPAAGDGQDPQAVWSNGYAGVWHLSGDLADSTVHANHGTDHGSLPVAGAVGGGRSFNGSAWISVPSSSSLELAGTLSLEGLAQVGDTNRAVAGRIVDKKNVWTDPAGFDLEYHPTLDRLTAVGANDTFLRASGVNLDTSWHYLAAALSGASGAVYVDGANRTTDPTVTPVTASSQGLAIGRRSGGGDYWLGALDEIRLSNVARSAAWFAAQQRSMTDAFLSFAPEQSPTVFSATTALLIQPQTVALSFATDPPGLGLTIGAQPVTDPVMLTAIVGATATVYAPSPQSVGGSVYVFTSWSDGGAQSHLVAAPETPAGWTARFVKLAPCGDGLDNDGDGLTDYPADPGCRDAAWETESPACDDNLDNDGDGKRDWDGAGVGAPDPQCTAPWKRAENGGKACGLGFELVFLTPLALRLRRLKRLRA